MDGWTDGWMGGCVCAYIYIYIYIHIHIHVRYNVMWHSRISYDMGWVLTFMLKVSIFMLSTFMSPSTSMPPSRPRHGCFLMLMGSPLMPEVFPSMLAVSLFVNAKLAYGIMRYSVI